MYSTLRLDWDLAAVAIVQKGRILFHLRDILNKYNFGSNLVVIKQVVIFLQPIHLNVRGVKTIILTFAF